MRKLSFTSDSATLSSDSKFSLEVLGAIINNRKSTTLNIVVYHAGNTQLAKDKAHSIKEYLLDRFPEVSNKRILESWFGVPETMRINGRTVSIDEPVSFFSD